MEVLLLSSLHSFLTKILKMAGVFNLWLHCRLDVIAFPRRTGLFLYFLIFLIIFSEVCLYPLLAFLGVI